MISVNSEFMRFCEFVFYASMFCTVEIVSTATATAIVSMGRPNVSKLSLSLATPRAE